MLKSFENVRIERAQSGDILGTDLLKTIAVVYFEKNNLEAGTLMSKNCDVRLVWGGNEAVQAIYLKKWMAEDIIMT